MITINNKIQSLRKWCIELHLNYHTVWNRLNKFKWSIEQALGLLPPPQKIQKPVIDRIIDNIRRNPETFCWEWNGTLTEGYGHIKINGKMTLVHRAMYQYVYGSIPKPFVLHRCDNRKCCNPMHLYAGTSQDNMHDRVKRNPESFIYSEKHGNAKLIEKQVKEVRKSEEPQAVIAKRLNVSQGTISKIKSRKSWKHID